MKRCSGLVGSPHACATASLSVLFAASSILANASCTHDVPDEQVGAQSSALVGVWNTDSTIMGGAPRAAFTLVGNAISLTTGDVLYASGGVAGGGVTGVVALFGASGFAAKADIPKGRTAMGQIALDDGTALILGGGNTGGGSNFTAEVNIDRWSPNAPQWTAAGSLQVPRLGPSTTRLVDGRIFIAGGTGPGNPLTQQLGSAELYNTTTNTSVATTGSFSPGRLYHVAGLLSGGKVAIIGGDLAVTGAQAIAVFDPTTQLFTNGPNIISTRFGHTGARLPNGKILYCGGCTLPTPCEGAALSTCEIFDGTTVTATGSLTQSSGLHSMITLATGKVLLVGGVTAGGTTRNRAELYDPATGLWTATGSLATGRYEAGIGLLGSGRAVIAGGRFGPTSAGSTYLASAEIYDPGTATTCKVQQLDGTINALNNGVACDDSNPCTATDVCATAVCVGAPVANGTACATGTCQSGVCVAPSDAGSDAADASDAAAVSDASDAAAVSDANDAAVVSDANDAATVSDASDAAAVSDASDAATVSDASDGAIVVKDAIADAPVVVDSGKDAAKDTGSPVTPDTGTGTTDSGSAPDGGVDTSTGGCSCQTASTSAPGNALFASLFLPLAFLGRRRSRTAKR